MTLYRALLAATAVLLACLPAASAPPEVKPGWDYVITLDEGFTKAEVRLCFRGFLPKRLVVGNPGVLPAFRYDAVKGAARLERRQESVVPVGLARGGCVAWQVDLEKLLGLGGRRGRARRVGRDLLVPPASLLLKPALWRAGLDVTVRFELAKGMRAAVPWPRTPDGKGYLLDRHALRLSALVAIGRMPVDGFQAAGATVDVAVLDGEHLATRTGIHTWLKGAILAQAQLHGRFPAQRLTVIVHPIPARSPSVVFGSAMRGGGPHVHLLIASSARDADLPGEWVGVHELGHIGMPWTYDTEPWLQEGFVTYYQEVLRARAGFLSETEAWQKLHEGFGRGRRSGGTRTLEHESREMGEHHTYHRVYWAGAAIALLIDVELRTRYPRRWSLDDLMRQWHASHGDTRSRATYGLKLLQASDRRIGANVVRPIAAKHLASTSFPDLSAVFAQLGVVVEAGRVRLDDRAPLASFRRAIMAPRKAPASPSDRPDRRSR